MMDISVQLRRRSGDVVDVKLVGFADPPPSFRLTECPSLTEPVLYLLESKSPVPIYVEDDRWG
jgi:hypothetical protein